jgi:hypothetical protein
LLEPTHTCEPNLMQSIVCPSYTVHLSSHPLRLTTKDASTH